MQKQAAIQTKLCKVKGRYRGRHTCAVGGVHGKRQTGRYGGDIERNREEDVDGGMEGV